MDYEGSRRSTEVKIQVQDLIEASKKNQILEQKLGSVITQIAEWSIL